MLPERKDSILFCICAPAGSGKSTLCRRLTKEDAGLIRSISTTTRAPREGEVDGVHYHFVDKVEFDARLSKGLFFEHAKFGGNKYGTEKRNIELASSSGNDLLMAIDVQGVRRLKELCPERVVTVFLFPPSFADLEQRLRRRGTESEEMQERRLRIAEQEIKELSAPGFADYFLINDDLEAAVQGAHAVLKAERQRFSRVSAEFLSSILEP